MFNNSKYGNLLTVILIISIIAILGIVGIIIYRMYNAHYIDTGATQAATQFEQSIQQNTNTITNVIGNVGIENNNAIINNNINPGINIEGINGSTAPSTGTQTGNTQTGNTQTTTKYKGYDVIGTIQIPSINLKYPILEQLTKKSLETSVVLLYTAQGLNNQGNSVIIGHNYRNGTMFSNVKKLSNGDYIYITDQSGRKVRYTVYNIYRASGSESSYMTRNTNGKREISLSTCTDDSKARTIVLARES